MKKYLSLIITLACLLVFIIPVFAVDIGFGEDGMAQNIAEKAGYEASTDEYALSRTVGGIIRGVLSVIGVLFLVLTIYAGVLWMTASGNEESISKAKKIITSSLIGLVIVVAAYGITALVFNFIIGAQAPSTDVGGAGSSPQLGCCVRADNEKCTQTASRGHCDTKYGSGARWYPGESCTPYITQETGCAFEASM